MVEPSNAAAPLLCVKSNAVACTQTVWESHAGSADFRCFSPAMYRARSSRQQSAGVVPTLQPAAR